MKQFFLLFLCTISFAACSKKDDGGTDACPTGKIRYRNSAAYTYKIYLDDNYKGLVTPGSFKEYDVPKGYHKTKALQDGGPGFKEGEYTLLGCDQVIFEFQ